MPSFRVRQLGLAIEEPLLRVNNHAVCTPLSSFVAKLSYQLIDVKHSSRPPLLRNRLEPALRPIHPPAVVNEDSPALAHLEVEYLPLAAEALRTQAPNSLLAACIDIHYALVRQRRQAAIELAEPQLKFSPQS